MPHAAWGAEHDSARAGGQGCARVVGGGWLRVCVWQVWSLTPTAVTNWHFKFVVGRAAGTLWRLVLRDALAAPGGRWAEHPSRCVFCAVVAFRTEWVCPRCVCGLVGLCR